MKMRDFIQTFTCVKSVVTISLTACFIFLCVSGAVSSENFMTIYVMIIGFYFGTQWQKRAEPTEQEKRMTAKQMLNAAYGMGITNLSSDVIYADTDGIKTRIEQGVNKNGTT